MKKPLTLALMSAKKNLLVISLLVCLLVVSSASIFLVSADTNIGSISARYTLPSEGGSGLSYSSMGLGNNYLFVAASPGGGGAAPRVEEINPATMLSIGVWNTSDYSGINGFVASGSYVYVSTTFYNDSIFGYQGIIVKIAASTMTEVANFTQPNIGEYLALCTDGSYLYCNDGGTNLLKIDMATMTAGGEVNLADYYMLYCDSDYLYAYFSDTGLLKKIDPSNLSVLVTSSSLSSVLYGSLSFIGDSVFGMGHVQGTVIKIDSTTLTVTGQWNRTTEFSGDINLRTYACTTLGNYVYILVTDGETPGSGIHPIVIQVDPATMLTTGILTGDDGEGGATTTANMVSIMADTSEAQCIYAHTASTTTNDMIDKLAFVAPAPTSTPGQGGGGPEGGGSGGSPSPAPVNFPTLSPTSSSNSGGWVNTYIIQPIQGFIAVVGQLIPAPIRDAWGNLSSIAKNGITVLLFLLLLVLFAAAFQRRNKPAPKT